MGFALEVISLQVGGQLIRISSVRSLIFCLPEDALQDQTPWRKSLDHPFRMEHIIIPSIDHHYEHMSPWYLATRRLADD